MNMITRRLVLNKVLMMKAMRMDMRTVTNVKTTVMMRMKEKKFINH